VVDDDAFSAYCLTKQLNTYGYSADTASSGKVARERFDTIIASNCC
jgi:CheY-like chemotaxis protein